MFHAQKEKEKEDAAQKRGSALGLPLDMARARVRMGKEAAEALDAESIEWLCGPGGIRGADWLLTRPREPLKSVFDREPSVIEKWFEATLSAEAKETGRAKAESMERAMRIFRALAGSGLSLQEEAKAAGALCALSRLADLAMPTAMPSVRISTSWEKRQGKGEVIHKRPELASLADTQLLSALGQEAMRAVLRSGVDAQAGLERLSRAVEKSARSHGAAESAMGANPFFAAAHQALSEWNRKEMLGDEANRKGAPSRAAARI